MAGRPSTAYTSGMAKVYDQKRFLDAAGQAIHAREVGLLKEATRGLPPGAKVLEVGAGTGRLLVELLDSGLNLTGVDASPDMLSQSEQKFQKAKSPVVLREAESAHLPFSDNEFDLAYSIRLLNQTESPDYAKATIGEMIRVVKPQGLVLVEFVNRYRPSGRAKATKLSVKEVLECGHLAGAEPVRVQGAFVLGMSAHLNSPPQLQDRITRLDSQLARLVPRMAARCYVLLRKNT